MCNQLRLKDRISAEKRREYTAGCEAKSRPQSQLCAHPVEVECLFSLPTAEISVGHYEVEMQAPARPAEYCLRPVS